MSSNFVCTHKMLTDSLCKSLKPKDTVYRKADGNGMCLEVLPNGNKYWRLRYRINGKAKLLSLGVYPEVSLKEARKKTDELRELIANGQDPSDIRKKQKIERQEYTVNTFENIAEEYLAKKKGVLSERYHQYISRRLETNIFPFLGNTPIKKITPKELLTVITDIEMRGAIETSHRVLQEIGQVYRYAIATGRAEHDITADLRGALQSTKERHYAYLSERDFKEFLEKLTTFKLNVSTKQAWRLLILTFVRSGELRGASWDEFDLQKKEWRIPAGRMKMKEQHIVPLSEQALKLLKEIKETSVGVNLLFPCRTDINKPISDNTLSKVLRDNEYQGKATPHGIRATASTILNENGFAPDVIERQLAHCERNKIRAAYNHAMYLPERKEMMMWWGNYIEERMIKNEHI